VSKWVWGGTTADFNPSQDSGWVSEVVFAEQHVIGSSSSIIQEGGVKSARRKVSGVTKSTSFKSALDALHLGRTIFTLVDHRGTSSSAKILNLQWQEVHDVTNLPGYTFKYDIELVKR
jgi:hypothetical protein